MRLADLAVVGAGPAGSAAAITAARAGLDVVLIDKATFPRDKCCGDGLTAACLRELEALGLQPCAVASWQPVEEVVLHAPSTRRIELPLPSGAGSYSVVARRRDLDAALVDLSVQAGVELWQGEAAVAIAIVERGGGRGQGQGPIELRTTNRTVRARAVIGADGMWSPLRKLCGARHPDTYRGEWHAFRQYFSGATGDAARRQHIWFPADLLPGYVWSFPLPDGGLNVGYGILRGGSHAVGDGAALWRDLLHRPEIRSVLGDELVAEAPMRAWPIPARVGRATLSALGGRVLFVGDAATVADPMTGEGIGQALQSGRLASEAIVEHIDALRGEREPDRPAGAGPTVGGASDVAAVAMAVRYQRALRRELVADHRLADRLSRVLATRVGTEWSLRAVDASAWSRRNFARWMFEDYPRALLATPRRWRRGQFHRRGAYDGAVFAHR